MTDNYFDPMWTEKVKVPVKRVGSNWEFFYGGDVPVKDGTLGELTISASRITEEDFLRRVTQELKIKILKEGTPLLVALSDRSNNGFWPNGWPEKFPTATPPGTTRWERVHLGPAKPPTRKATRSDGGEQVLPEGGLHLRVRGLERCELLGSTVSMPDGFHEKTATSLNHAFTLLSEAYEQHRISHTGNVYTQIFYQDTDQLWYPLDDLRQGVRAEAERELLRNLWSKVEEKLGWRPAPPPPANKTRRSGR